MGVTQYIGRRYAPIFADPIEWDSSREYESLTIVTHEGNTYTSKTDVPSGTPITNERYWALTADASRGDAVASRALELAQQMAAKFPVSASDGGTGVDSAQAERDRLGLGDTTGPVPIANGGTGATDAASARLNLDAAQSGGAVGTLRDAEQKLGNPYGLKVVEYQFLVNNMTEHQYFERNIEVPGYTPIGAFLTEDDYIGASTKLYAMYNYNLSGKKLMLSVFNPNPASSSTGPAVSGYETVKVFYVPSNQTFD